VSAFFKNKSKNPLEEKNRTRDKNCKAFIKIVIKKDTILNTYQKER